MLRGLLFGADKSPTGGRIEIMRNLPFNRAQTSVLALATVAGLLAAGCTHQQPVAMAPPVSQPMQAAPPMQQPMNNGGYANNGGMDPSQQGAQNVFPWNQVPLNQQVPITRAVFDQGGYQLYDNTGDTIAIPFANQNMYVLKFGQSANGSTYFVNDGNAPTLYVPSGGYLENAAAQGAKWYPFSQGFQYTQPVYLGIAPTWNDYVGMGWYPGMSYYGGYWGLHPGMAFSPMAGLYFNIGGTPYYGWNSYQSYYGGHPYNRVYVRSAPSYSFYSAGRGTTGSFGRSSGFGGSANTFDRFLRDDAECGRLDRFLRDDAQCGWFDRFLRRAVDVWFVGHLVGFLRKRSLDVRGRFHLRLKPQHDKQWFVWRRTHEWVRKWPLDVRRRQFWRRKYGFEPQLVRRGNLVWRRTKQLRRR